MCLRGKRTRRSQRNIGGKVASCSVSPSPLEFWDRLLAEWPRRFLPHLLVGLVQLHNKLPHQQQKK